MSRWIIFFLTLSLVWMTGAYWVLQDFVYNHNDGRISAKGGLSSSLPSSSGTFPLQSSSASSSNNNHNQRPSSTFSAQQDRHRHRPRILSRVDNNNNNNNSTGNTVKVTADVRGNLGPIDVILQQTPGTHWLKDRWQAASDMHGTNIPGAHWVQLEFTKGDIVPNHLILDWEAAYADVYVLQGSREGPITGDPPLASNHNDNDNGHNSTSDAVYTLFDGRDKQQRKLYRTVQTSGQSPGVKTTTPLHVIHTINLTTISPERPLRYLRLFILKSAMGWGVSLWQFDVYGYEMDTAS